LLTEYTFAHRLEFFHDIEGISSWIEKMTGEGKIGAWNVVVAGKESDANSSWQLQYGVVNKVKRSRKINYDDETLINVGALRDPKDIIADVDLEGKPQNIVEMVRNFKAGTAKALRELAGLGSTPQIIIYLVDKNSKALDLKTRKDLNAPQDLAGICMNIPGRKSGVGFATKISIDLGDPIFDEDGDLEGTNAD